MSLIFNNTLWKYDPAFHVYYQLGIPYCAAPETLEYETLAVYVPGEYMEAKDNGDGTYTCTANPDGTVSGFTAATAPVAIPVRTPGYMALKALDKYKYTAAQPYLDAGFIYVHAGCRGRNNGYDKDGNLEFSGGAPWGVTDLKAAVRYLRYNSAVLPGDQNRIFTFGMSGGGAQSALMGASGDSELYTPYLESIGAIMTDDSGAPISDAVAGAMCWCPVTTLDVADQAYEWNMGQYSREGTRADHLWTSLLSKDMSLAFAEHINRLGLVNADGAPLTLTESEAGIYAAGSYYDCLMQVINRSLTNYLADNGLNTEDEIRTYLSALNTEEEWITYDPASGVSVKDMAAVAKYWKLPGKAVGAFDSFAGTAPENRLFGNDEHDAAHYNPLMAKLMADHAERYSAADDWDPDVIPAYAAANTLTDKLGKSIRYRQNTYNPMYYLSPAYEGYRKSTLAKYWRIRSGLKQSDTALTTEVNMALCLAQFENVALDFETVWDQPHVEAERTGDSTENFIRWVYDCLDNPCIPQPRNSGTGEVEEEVFELTCALPYTLAEGYDKHQIVPFYIPPIDLTVPVFVSADKDETRFHMQFSMFGGEQLVVVEHRNGALVVTADRNGFAGRDGILIAELAIKAGRWITPGPFEAVSPYTAPSAYAEYLVMNYHFAPMDLDVPILVSSDSQHTQFHLHFDLFEDEQIVEVTTQGDALVVTYDKTGFFGMEGPAIARAALKQNTWFPND